jgi:hypothetical protein
LEYSITYSLSPSGDAVLKIHGHDYCREHSIPNPSADNTECYLPFFTSPLGQLILLSDILLSSPNLRMAIPSQNFLYVFS